MLILSAILALSAAAIYGFSSVLQQAIAQKEKNLPIVGLKVMRRLVRRPLWLLALSLSAFSFIVQAIALAFGPLTLVQPLAAMDLLFALPLLANHQRHHIKPKEWLASLMVAGGIIGFLTISPPSSGLRQPSIASWVMVILGVGVVVTAITFLSYSAKGTRRTMLLAGAGGLLFAVMDAFTKGFVDLIDSRGVIALVSWEPYALMTAGLLGMIFAQGAYRSGSLVTSLPIIDTVEPIAAVLIGATAFNEHLGGSPLLWLTQLISALIAVMGIAILARSTFVNNR